MGQSETPRRYSFAEYFDLEKQSEMRHEYIDGNILEVTGVTISHSLITQNIALSMRKAVREKGCRSFSKGVLTEVKENFHYTYPDVVVSCDPDDRRDPYLVRRPVLIVEVLSPSTAEYDRSRKFNQYKKLPSLRHYVLVSQTAWVLEWFRRDEAGQWIYTVLSDPADVLEIPDLNLRLPLANVYDDTDVSPLQLAPQPDTLSDF